MAWIYWAVSMALASAAQPTRPATDRFRARQPRSEEWRVEAGRGAALARSGAWLRSTGNASTGENSFPGRIHPRMAWIDRTCRKSVEGGEG
ncbi:hypothetical protein FJU31_17505 [Stenotrophomonas cyclobalanopsidis]|uniref:Secreted protein n=1 Tax=Stenotrophomonas cyclobalanopsidis TaxID=2771362 RepID=A0ABQ6SX59_9GAMM|nr:hypothetical protein FJU31_17505 [Stenotrophomonas cyclobalanopsidis]